MLVNNQRYNKDDVVTFKIVNGDEIIAKFVEETDTEYVIYNPTTVVPSPQGIGLIQTMFTSVVDKNVRLGKNHVVMSLPTIPEMLAHYTKTTTGIETVPTSSIIT